jgi:hypothetical protein
MSAGTGQRGHAVPVRERNGKGRLVPDVDVTYEEMFSVKAPSRRTIRALQQGRREDIRCSGRARGKGSIRKLPAAATPFLAAAAALTALAVPASAATVTIAPRSVPASSAPHTFAVASSATVQFSGGMVADQGGSATVPGPLPSCHAITYRGDGGAIYVQTSPSGTVVWGIYMYDRQLDAGPWTVDVFVGKRLDDRKVQDYAPHGSVSPKHARKGAVFSITATHYATANETWYDSVPNGCIIP